MDLIKRELLFKSGYYNLDRNENTDAEYLEQLNKIQRKINVVNVYPDYPEFTKKVASFFQVESDEVLLTCGCTEAIKIVGDYLVQRVIDVLVLNPTYESAVSYLKLLGANIHTLPAESSMDDIVKYINENDIKFFYLCNPNNPTGTLYDLEELKKLRLCRALVFIDESYFEFCGVTAIPLIKSTWNIIVGRSFSKAWGLAGLRAGLLISSREVIQRFTPYKLKASFNIVAIQMITELIKKYGLVLNSVERLKEGDTWLRRSLKECGYTIYNEPNVNFIVSDVTPKRLNDLNVLYKMVGDRTCIAVAPVEQAKKIFKFQGCVSTESVPASCLSLSGKDDHQ